jgi:hypothetical protein
MLARGRVILNAFSSFYSIFSFGSSICCFTLSLKNVKLYWSLGSAFASSAALSASSHYFNLAFGETLSL